MECLKREKNDTGCARCKDIYHFIYHEVTTPMSVLLLNLYRLDEVYSNSKLVSICKRSVSKVTNILKVFLLENNNNESRTNIKKTLKELLGQYNKECSFKIDIPGNAEMPIARDAFEIVLKNLIRNTIEHSQRERPIIKMSFETTAQGSVFCYADNGKGINLDKQPAVFNYRYSSSEKQGRGYGLMLSKYLVSQSGGSITCRSDGSSYTEFVIKYH